MSQHDIRSARRPEPDQPMRDVADYVVDYRIDSDSAYETARYMLLDSLGCAMLAMKFPECVKHLGPIVPGATLDDGARVPGTSWQLDPVQAAYNIGVQVRWLDFNDTWLAAEWGHPSDNLGTILAVADYLSRRNARDGGEPLTIRDVLTAAIKAHEIQGCYALQNSFNQIGMDHVILVRLASTAVATQLLGGSTTFSISSTDSNIPISQGIPSITIGRGGKGGNAHSLLEWWLNDEGNRSIKWALLTLLAEGGIEMP